MKKGTRISLENLRIDWRTRRKVLKNHAPIVAAFEISGVLPPKARSRLVDEVAFAVGRAFFSVGAKQVASPPKKLAAQAESIVSKVRQLRSSTINAPLSAALQAQELLDIEKAAESIALEQQQRLRAPNKRNMGMGSLEELQYALFDIYAKTRGQYPDTGPNINLNAATMFVRVVLKAAKVDARTDKHLRETVRGALRRWRASRTN